MHNPNLCTACQFLPDHDFNGRDFRVCLILQLHVGQMALKVPLYLLIYLFIHDLQSWTMSTNMDPSWTMSIVSVLVSNWFVSSMSPED